jgi:hypothetical protein
MGRGRHFVLLFILVGLVTAVATAPADAAKRRVPFGFFGTVLNPDLAYATNLSDASLDAQMGLMARSGVESVRIPLAWGGIEPGRGVYSWPATDRLVAAAARHRRSVLANVLSTPRWASSRPNSTFDYSRFAPTDPQLFAEFMRQLVGRYGPRGTFWTLNRGIPRTPVRQWQIWNEQAADWMWASTPWPASYTKFLRAGYGAVHRADRGAQVVAGSVVGIGGSTPWSQLRLLYRAGAKRYFDVVSVHPFTNNPRSVGDTVRRVVAILELTRAEMRRHGDSRKPVIVTELAFPAAVGRVPRSRLLGLETTSSGQVKRLSAAYTQLAKDNRRLRIAQVYWFTWASPYDANSRQSDVSYRFAGLLRSGVDSLGRLLGSAFTPMPPLTTYRSLAARYEGCRKRDDARRCR